MCQRHFGDLTPLTSLKHLWRCVARTPDNARRTLIPEHGPVSGKSGADSFRGSYPARFLGLDTKETFSLHGRLLAMSVDNCPLKWSLFYPLSSSVIIWYCACQESVQ